MPRAKTITQKRVSELTGVSERTLHRWKASGAWFTNEELVEMQEEVTEKMIKRLVERVRQTIL